MREVVKSSLHILASLQSRMQQGSTGARILALSLQSSLHYKINGSNPCLTARSGVSLSYGGKRMVGLGQAVWNGRRFAEDRRAAGYVASEIADLAGISTASVIQYEGNKVEPGLTVACMMANALGYEVTRYVTWESFE
jgi:DNA-binding XRE family transcriptional regulator